MLCDRRRRCLPAFVTQRCTVATFAVLPAGLALTPKMLLGRLPPSENLELQLPTDPLTRLERDALMAILQHPEDVGRELVLRLALVSFSNPTLQVVRDGIAASMDAFSSPQWVERVAGEVPSAFAGIVNQLVVAPIPEKSGRSGSFG